MVFNVLHFLEVLLLEVLPTWKYFLLGSNLERHMQPAFLRVGTLACFLLGAEPTFHWIWSLHSPRVKRGQTGLGGGLLNFLDRTLGFWIQAGSGLCDVPLSLAVLLNGSLLGKWGDHLTTQQMPLWSNYNRTARLFPSFFVSLWPFYSVSYLLDVRLMLLSWAPSFWGIYSWGVPVGFHLMFRASMVGSALWWGV